jgi:hypothetical protein
MIIISLIIFVLFMIFVCHLVWSGLVWSAGQHLEWDEAVITSVATSIATNKQTATNNYPNIEPSRFSNQWLDWGVWQIWSSALRQLLDPDHCTLYTAHCPLHTAQFTMHI